MSVNNNFFLLHTYRGQHSFRLWFKAIYVQDSLTTRDFVENHTEAEINLSAGRRTVVCRFVELFQRNLV